MPAYELPELDISAEKEEEINEWLYKEITNALLARSNREKLWNDILELCEKQELSEKKDFPWPGAAYLMIGVIPTYIEEIKSKILSTMFAPRDPFTPRLTNNTFKDFVKPVRNFCTWAADNELDHKKLIKSAVTETLRLGDSATKTIYTRDVRTFMEYDPTIDKYVERVRVMKDQPEHIHMRLKDFLFESIATSIDTARWKGDRTPYQWHELQAGERRGDFVDVKRIQNWERADRDEQDTISDRAEGVEPVSFGIYDVWEIWFWWPLGNKGELYQLVWKFHLESKTCLRKEHAWFPAGLHPYDLLGFELREHRVYHRGVGEIAAPFQKEISAMHNQRLDAGTVANAKAFVRKPDGSTPSELQIRPGGTIPADNPKEDIVPLDLGSKYDSTITDEEHTIKLLQQRLGLQDYMSADSMQGATSTNMLALLAEGKRRQDMFIDDVRVFMSSLMTKALLLYQKYSTGGQKAYMALGDKEGEAVQQVMSFPPEWLISGIAIDVTATTATSSRELDRQNKLSLFGMMTQYYGQLTQYLMQANNPQLPDNVRLAMFRIVDGLTTMVEDILDDFDLRNTEELGISIAELTEAANQARTNLQAQTAGLAPRLPTPGGIMGGGAGAAA